MSDETKKTPQFDRIIIGAEEYVSYTSAVATVVALNTELARLTAEVARLRVGAERHCDLVLAAYAVLDGDFAREDTERADALFVCLRQAIATSAKTIPRGMCWCQPIGDGFHVCKFCCVNAAMEATDDPR